MSGLDFVINVILAAITAGLVVLVIGTCQMVYKKRCKRTKINVE